MLTQKVPILVVDDEANNRFALSEVLDDLDENVVLAPSGRDALRYLLQNECAVILLDVNMPGMDGYEAAALIRQRERSRQIPIIFISAVNKEDTHVARAYGLGAVDYVFKPVDPLILKSKVAVFVDLYKKTLEVQQKAEFERVLQAENMRVRAEKLETELALRRVEEQQASIVRSLPIVLYSATYPDFSGPRYISELLSRTTGYEPADYVRDPDLWVEHIHPDDRKRVLGEIGSLQEGGVLSTEYRWCCADGTHVVVLDRAVLRCDVDGTPRELFGSCLDITARKQMEQQLFQSQKMESLGQLTGGLAHDFNNMLAVVIGNLDGLSRTITEPGRNTNRIQMALTGALSCAELTRRLLAFARRQPLHPKSLDFRTLIANTTQLLEHVLGEKIQLRSDIDDNLWSGMADSAQVESAIMNLALNARDAMLDGGTITIAACNVNLDGDPSDQEQPYGEFVMISVADTGHGMSHEVIQRVFEPFFTTKKTGQGSGLGLSMVYGFVKQSGGHVRIESVPGTGTTVRLYLPRSESPSVVVPIETRVHSNTCIGIDLTALLVEDDANVRHVAAAAVQDLGFHVIETDSAVAALKVLEERGRDIHLLFTDIVMPGEMSGLDLAREARRLYPDLRILMTSGYTSSVNVDNDLGEFLRKPYRESELLQKLLHLLPANTAPVKQVASSG